MKGRSKISVFEYLDYRKYLRDYYEQEKKSRAGFSFRTFSKKAGFGSSNFYKLVMDGDRNLTDESVVPFARGLNLNKQETEFFAGLVLFGQAKDHTEKDLCYQRLLRSKKFSQLKPMEGGQYEYYSSWYHSVIRELITSPGFDGSAEWLAGKINPPLPVPYVENSIHVLEKIGFIEKDKDGKWVQAQSLVTTGAEAASLVMMTYHKNLLEFTRDRIAQIPAAERDVSSLTLGVRKSLLPQIKMKIQQFRKEILEMVAQETVAEEVVFLNMQMIPVTQSSQKENS